LLFDEGIENSDAFPVVFVFLYEFVVVGGLLVLVMAVFVLEHDVQADLPVANIYIPFVRFDELAGGEGNNAGMVAQVLVAVLDEFCSGGFGIIIQRKIDIVDEMGRFLLVYNQPVCAAGYSYDCCSGDDQCTFFHDIISKRVFE